MLAALVLAVVAVLTPGAAPPPAAAPHPAGVSAYPGGVDVDYQLGGASTPAPDVGVVVRDRTEPPADGVYNVCYVNGFQTQPHERRFWRGRRDLVLERNGKPVIDQAWNEMLLDIRRADRRERLVRIVGRWVDRCAADGYDAVEFDNLDSFSRSRGLIRTRQTRWYAARLVRRAHAAGLAVAQKNWASFDGTRIGFDFAIAEECGRYRECGDYVASYDNRVMVVEYRRQDFRRACAGYGDRLGIVLRDRALTPDGPHEWC